MSRKIWLASALVSAQCTWMPFSVHFCSSFSSNSGSLLSERWRMALPTAAQLFERLLVGKHGLALEAQAVHRWLEILPQLLYRSAPWRSWPGNRLTRAQPLTRSRINSAICLAGMGMFWYSMAPGDIQQATAIAREQKFGAGLADIVNFIPDHRRGNLRLLNGKSAAETATLMLVSGARSIPHCLTGERAPWNIR